MPSAGSFRRFETWIAGDASARVIDIGTVSQPNRERATNLGFLRVGYLGAGLLHPVDAMLSIGDNGSILGPIDVPLSLTVEEPVRLHLTPVGVPVAEVRVVLAVTPVSCVMPLDFATRSMVALAGAVLLLPQWVRTVLTLAPATFVFRDRAGVALSGALSGAFVRPPMAADVTVGVGGTVVFSY